MSVGLAKRLLGVAMGIVLGLVLAGLAGPYLMHALGGQRAPHKSFVLEGGF